MVGRPEVAAVIALTPLVDGLAAGRLALKHHSKRMIVRSTGSGLRGKLSAAVGRSPVVMPLVAGSSSVSIGRSRPPGT